MARGVEVRGEEKLSRALEDARGRVADLTPPHKQLAAAFLNQARAEAPVLTGTLVSSLRSSAGKRTVGIRSRLIYAAPVHFGWPGHNIAANPFLIRARDSMTAEAVRGYDAYLKEVMAEVTRKSDH